MLIVQGAAAVNGRSVTLRVKRLAGFADGKLGRGAAD